jgi:hypothetical protein
MLANIITRKRKKKNISQMKFAILSLCVVLILMNGAYSSCELIGKELSLETANFLHRYLRHSYFEAWSAPYQKGDGLQDFAFNVVKGLCGKSGSVSFQSKNYPTKYLVNEDGCINLCEVGSDKQLKKDASFYVKEPLLEGPGFSFESVSVPGSYMRHFEHRVILSSEVGIHPPDATWILKPSIDRPGA